MKKNNKKITVSVGISAFNEEPNIINVLRAILKQNEHGWKLKEILVYDDGSDDDTVEKAKKVKSPLIKIIADKQRKGKTQRLSEMFQAFSSDILVMFDGDIQFKDNDAISHLVKTFSVPSVMLVGGNSRPFPPQSFFQQCVYATFAVFDRSRNYIKGGNNVFGCTGSILAIKKELARKIHMPKIINEDVYIYLDCLRNNYQFRYQKDAIIYYKLPTNLPDYLRQAFRSNPEAVEVELTKYFGDLVEKEFHRSLFFYFKSIFLTFLSNPLPVLCISFINILLKPFYPFISKRYKLEWFTAASTHKL